MPRLVCDVIVAIVLIDPSFIGLTIVVLIAVMSTSLYRRR